MENGNKDGSSEDHLQSLKSSRGSYLELEISIFVQKTQEKLSIIIVILSNILNLSRDPVSFKD